MWKWIKKIWRIIWDLPEPRPITAADLQAAMARSQERMQAELERSYFAPSPLLGAMKQKVAFQFIPDHFEYLFIWCDKCGDSVKLAKNEGADWAEIEGMQHYRDYNNLEYFLLLHNKCPVSEIKLEWRR